MKNIFRAVTFRVLSVAMSVAVTPAANALEVTAIHPYFEFGLEFGGDKLAEEGGGYGPVKTNAGGGLNFSAGALLNLQGEILNGDLLIALGYLDNDGDEVDLSANRLDLVYLFNGDRSPHRLGIGPTFHFNSRLELDPDPVENCVFNCFDSSFPRGTTKFDDAIGLTFRYEYNLFPQYNDGGGVTLGVRCTLIEYESKVDNVDASGLGIYINIF